MLVSQKQLDRLKNSANRHDTIRFFVSALLAISRCSITNTIGRANTHLSPRYRRRKMDVLRVVSGRRWTKRTLRDHFFFPDLSALCGSNRKVAVAVMKDKTFIRENWPK